MAEVTSLRNNALNYPVYGVPWTIVFPMLDEDGDPTTGLTCDSEVSLNGDTGADCTNEGTEIPYTTATNKGMYYLTLTAAEMTADIVTVTIYSGVTTTQATCIVLYPRKLVSLRTGTSQGGAAGYITLDASAGAVNDTWNGCLCVATIDTLIEARIITDYTASSQQAAVTPGWNVAPDADDTFVIYLPEGMQIPQAVLSLSAGAVTTGSFAAGAINAAAIADAAIDNATLAADIGSTAYATNIIALAVRKVLDELNLDHLAKVAVANNADLTTEVVDATVLSHIMAAGDTSGFTTGTDSLKPIAADVAATHVHAAAANTTTPPTVAAIATAIWQDTTAGDFTTASSIGKSLYTAGVVPGGTNGLFIAGTNAATVITTSLTTGAIVLTTPIQSALANVAHGGAAATLTLLSAVVNNTGGVGVSVTGSTTGVGIHGASIGLDLDANAGPAADIDGTTFGLDINASAGDGVQIVGTVADIDSDITGTLATVTTLSTWDKTGYALTVTPPTAAQVATAVWQDTTANDLNVASSIGKSLFTSGVVPGAASGLALVGSKMDLVDAPNATAVASIKTNLGTMPATLAADVTVAAASRASIRSGLSTFKSASDGVVLRASGLSLISMTRGAGVPTTWAGQLNWVYAGQFKFHAQNTSGAITYRNTTSGAVVGTQSIAETSSLQTIYNLS